MLSDFILTSSKLQLSLQYHKDDGLCVRPLAVKDTKADHTNLNTKHIILDRVWLTILVIRQKLSNY